MIFIDGLNDFFYPSDPPIMTLSWTKQTEERLAHPVLTALRTLPVVRLAASLSAKPVFIRVVDGATGTKGAAGRRKVDAVIQRYAGNKRIIDAIGAAFGVPVLLVWQPVPLYKYDLEYHTFDGDFGNHELARIGYPSMREYVHQNGLGENFIWCADIQEGVEQLLYVDLVHYSPDMSRRVAECIAAGISPRRG